MKKDKTGFLIINKPAGPTSHDIINSLRKITGIQKIGHAGTLDPFASGVLIVAVGRETTKKIQVLVGLDKKYIATLRLGAESDTYDRDGKIVESERVQPISEKRIELALKEFAGKQKQVPPMYSAKKVKGRKLYQLARQGITIERQGERIEIFQISLLNYDFPILKIKVHCSSGTYIRALAHDIGKRLGCGAYLEELERIAVGTYNIDKAARVNEINKNNWWEFLGRIELT